MKVTLLCVKNKNDTFTHHFSHYYRIENRRFSQELRFFFEYCDSIFEKLRHQIIIISYCKFHYFIEARMTQKNTIVPNANGLSALNSAP